MAKAKASNSKATTILLIVKERLLHARRKRPLEAVVLLQLGPMLPPMSPHTSTAGLFIPTKTNKHRYLYVNMEVLLLRHVAWTLICGMLLNIRLSDFQHFVPRHTTFSKILETFFK